MEEDQQDTEWNDVSDGKHISVIECHADAALIGKFILQQLTTDEPTHHDTRKEGACRQHQLSCQHVAEVHQRQAEELDFLISTY